jgi:hypothetical protein
VRLEGLGQLKKIHLIGIRTHNLPVCSIVPQPTTLPRAPMETEPFSKNIQINMTDEVQDNNLRETFSLDFNSEGKQQK